MWLSSTFSGGAFAVATLRVMKAPFTCKLERPNPLVMLTVLSRPRGRPSVNMLTQC